MLDVPIVVVVIIGTLVHPNQSTIILNRPRTGKMVPTLTYGTPLGVCRDTLVMMMVRT
jgi:hypothetical protein